MAAMRPIVKAARIMLRFGGKRPVADDEPAGISADRLAILSARAMFERDRATQGLGMVIEEVRPGYARLRMAVREDMLNGHDTCHGGFVFSLADSTFAFACNSRNRVTVAAGAAIEFLGRSVGGDVLVAEAEERSLGGRLGVYDIVVRKQGTGEPSPCSAGARTLLRATVIRDGGNA